MPGLKLKLQVAVTDTTLQKLYDDKNMSNGTLLLVDFGKSKPADLNTGTTVPNVAQQTALALIGSAVPADVMPTITKGAGFETANVGKLEWTPKNGLHTLMTQVNHTDTNTQKFNIYMPVALRNYMYNNKAHTFFISVWRRNTRMALAGVAFDKMNILFATTSVYMSEEKMSDTADNTLTPSSGVRRIGGRNSVHGLGTYIKNVAVADMGGDPIPVESTVKGSTGNCILAIGGGLAAFGGVAILNKMASFVTYRILIEDLTVSGRTYAQADAIDIAQYTEAFAVGGRYYADTIPTDPATLP